AGGVRYYALDNEPFLWNYTHRDVRPEPVGYDELRDKAYTYGAAIKSADAGAKVFGPALWGATAYYYSGIDAASGNWDNPPDRLAHGDVPLVDWYLQQMRQYEQQNGTRILDYLDLHYYPQNSGVALQTAGDLATQQMRLRATRSLWDATYTDESWIANTTEPVMRLIPRMRDWVNQNYPGTKTAVTEYNYGGLEHINGALAQADVLGIFGRENLDLATLWDPPTINQPGAFAFRMYRNYDGNGAVFGDQYLRSTSQNQGQLAVYSAKRSSDGMVTVMVVNKSMASVQGDFTFVNYAAGLSSAEIYQYSADDLRTIRHENSIVINQHGTASYVFRANSITLFVFDPTDSNAPIYDLFLPSITK
ncbi:MAG TPA: endoglucanase, partial [Anaerolineae bacterium]|nr:endoglucanase [Anaerolineae bacterium]